MARPSYLINDRIRMPVANNASRIPLFSQQGGRTESLNGFGALPPGWGVQWKYFLPGIRDAEGDNDEFLPQPSYKVDTSVCHPLGELPDRVALPEVLAPGADPAAAQSLPVRNLLRGLRLGLPSGQDVARAMGVTPLTEAELYGGLALSDEQRGDLEGRAPLWFYVLKEAEIRSGAAHLGPVGGRIVAEVLIGLLAEDPLSFLSVDPTWTPFLDARTEGRFTLSDIVNLGLPPGEPQPSPYRGA